MFAAAARGRAHTRAADAVREDPGAWGAAPHRRGSAAPFVVALSPPQCPLLGRGGAGGLVPEGLRPASPGGSECGHAAAARVGVP